MGRKFLGLEHGRLIGLVRPGDVCRQHVGTGQPFAHRFLEDERALGFPATWARGPLLSIGLLRCFFEVPTSRRLQAQLDIIMVGMMLAADAICLARLVIMVMIAGIQTASATAQHTVNNHCQYCHHCCRPSRHHFRSHAIGKTFAFGIFVRQAGVPQVVSRGNVGRV